jgi:type I restriction enzyme S subunit
VRAGDVLFARRNTHLRRVSVAPFDCLFSPDGYAFRSSSPDLLQDYLPWLIASEPFMDFAVRWSAGTHSKRVKWSHLVNFEFDLPPVDEQRETAELLWAAETALRAGRRLIDGLGAQKRALFDAMTFKAHAPVWTVGELVDGGVLAPPQDGNHGEKHPKASDFIQDGIPFITASDLAGNQLDFGKCKYISESLAASLRVGVARQGDVVLTHKGTVGLSAIVPTMRFPYVMLSPQVTYYRVNDEEKLDTRYLASFFTSPGCQAQLTRLGKQSTRAYVSIKTQRKVRLPLPDIDAQLALVGRLSGIDAAIQQARRHLVATTQLRAVLLQQELAQSA